MATPVVSLPVPAVVGTGHKNPKLATKMEEEGKKVGRVIPAISGFTAPLTGFPLPIGALTKSRKSASG